MIAWSSHKIYAIFSNVEIHEVHSFLSVTNVYKLKEWRKREERERKKKMKKEKDNIRKKMINLLFFHYLILVKSSSNLWILVLFLTKLKIHRRFFLFLAFFRKILIIVCVWEVKIFFRSRFLFFSTCLVEQVFLFFFSFFF